MTTPDPIERRSVQLCLTAAEWQALERRQAARRASLSSTVSTLVVLALQHAPAQVTA